jgi:diguanylate cyclase (GGDEF)-like protein/PAS domain S-box-containing protein
MAPSRVPMHQMEHRAGPSLAQRLTIDGPAVVLGAVVLGLLVTVGFLVFVSDPQAQRVETDVLPPFLDLAAAWLIVKAAGRATNRRAEAGWLLIGLAMVVYLVGDALFAGFDLLATSVPYPGPADVAYVIYYPIMVVALLSFPSAPGAHTERRRLAIDSAIMIIGAAMVVWQSVVQPTLLAASDDPLESILTLGYPGGDIVLVFGIAAIALRRPTGLDPRALVALVGGLVLMLAADIGFGQLSLVDLASTQHWTDLLYMASTVAIAAAGYLQLRAAPRAAGLAPPAVPRALVYLPYLALAAGFGTLVLTALAPDHGALPGLLVGAVLMTTLVLVRQEIVLRENGRLMTDETRRQAEARFRSLAAQATDAITLVTPDGVVVDATDAARQTLGLEAATLIGRPLTSLAHADDRVRLSAFIGDTAARRPTVTTLDWRLWSGDGAWRQVETVAANLIDDPTIGYLVLTTRDVRERKALERQLQQVALRDVLTGLANRALFLDRVDRALAQDREDGRTTVVLVLNIDGFKRLNDGMGHPTGDRLLQEVAGRLEQTLRTADTCARLGGDEFGLLLDGSATADDGLAAAERIRAALHEPLASAPTALHVTVRIGIAASGPVLNAPSPLLRAASLAMTHARDGAHDGVAVFEPSMLEVLEGRFELENDLRLALARDELILQYQPIMSLATGDLVSAEALVRWDHPTRGRLAPSIWIAMAEETGLIDDIGGWVLRAALAEVTRWAGMARAVVPRVSVNLSPHQVADPQLPWTIQAALSQAGASPAWLTLELTEGLLMEHSTAVLERLHAIRSLGVSLSIDDFGTGYSSLAYLQLFPMTHLKIDRSFVTPLDDPAHGEGIVRAIVEIGRALGMTTVAEGIETRTQLERLQALGCDLGQGYLLGRPLDRDVIAELVRNPPQPAWTPSGPVAVRRPRPRRVAA